MSPSNARLDKETHTKILYEEIIPESHLNELNSHEKPKAIILAGQPGGGKGGLARAAEFELHHDVVTIDPDELRDTHPDVERLRQRYPYTWSGYSQSMGQGVTCSGDFAGKLNDEGYGHMSPKASASTSTTHCPATWTRSTSRPVRLVQSRHAAQDEISADDLP